MATTTPHRQTKTKFSKIINFFLHQISSIPTPLQIGLNTVAKKAKVKDFIGTHKKLFDQCKRIAQMRTALRTKLAKGDFK